MSAFLLAAALFTQNRSMVPDERSELLAKAIAATRAATAEVDADPERPEFHFHGPARWMNDPNGPIYYKGWYHLFYQFNPYGDQWGNMHWGHARSKDLVNWEHLPIALWPSKASGEEHVFSGSTVLDGHGEPRIFYTSIGPREPEQWMALPADPNLQNWTKSLSNPVISQATNAPDHLDEWRDPFFFKSDVTQYLVTGGRKDGHGIVALYQAENPELSKWRYRGILFRHPDSNLVECPNLVRLGDRVVLLTSHDGRVDWFSGHLDLASVAFQPDRRGVLAPGSYASQLVRDKHGRCVHLAWVPTSDRKGWNGYMTIPSVLKLDKHGDVLRNPISLPLVQSSTGFGTFDLTGKRDLGKEFRGDRLQMSINVDLGSASRFEIRVQVPHDGKGGQVIAFDRERQLLSIPDRDPISLHCGSKLKLLIFVDKCALDVYAGNGEVTACSAMRCRPGDDGVQLEAIDGTAKVRQLRISHLKPATFSRGPF